MQVNFIGPLLSDMQRLMIVNAVQSALTFIMSKRLADSLEIDINVCKNLIDIENIWGDVDCVDICKSPKLFEIRLNYSGPQSFNKLLKTLSHEIVHVWQFASRRMRYLSDQHKVGYLNAHYFTDKVSYLDRPWELEAFDMEHKIYDDIIIGNIDIANYVKKHNCKAWEETKNLD